MEGPPKQPDNLNIVAIVALTLGGALAVYIAFVSLQAYYLAEASKLEFEREAEGKSFEVRTLHAKHAEELQGYRWVNKHRQTVTLPIDKAMEIVVSEVRTGNPNDLVPAIGPQDTPTVPAAYGRPSDNAQMPGPTGQDDAAATQDMGGADEAAEGADADEAGAEGADAGDGTGAPVEGAADSSAAPAQGAAEQAGEAAGGTAPAGDSATGDAPAGPATGAPSGAAEPAGPAANTGGNATP